MHPLIYDWNIVDEPPAAARRVMLDDETLRDGLQSPSVRTPTIDQKIRILHLINDLGIDTADIGLPGAGPHVVQDVERLAREIVDAQAGRARQLRVADAHRRHPAHRGHRAAHRPRHRGVHVHRIEPDPPVRRGLDARSPAAPDRGGRELCREAGADRDVRHGRHDARRSGFAARAVLDGDSRRRQPHLHRGHGRPRDAGRRRGRREVRAVDRRRVRRRRRHRLARPSRSRSGHREQPGGDARRARRACTAPRSASASASATRRWTRCS